jgi:hypothetical protein
MFPVRYELGFCMPGDGILHSHHRENLKPYILHCCSLNIVTHQLFMLVTSGDTSAERSVTFSIDFMPHSHMSCFGVHSVSSALSSTVTALYAPTPDTASIIFAGSVIGRFDSSRRFPKTTEGRCPLLENGN